MTDIFADQKLYPQDGTIKEHFKDFYDSVYVSFLPFFKVIDQQINNSNFKRSQKISLQEAIEKDDLFKKLNPNGDRDIYSYDNENYPTDLEIYKNGTTVSWKSVIKDSQLKNEAELYKALRTSIGALRRIFSKPELAEKLNKYTTEQKIWHPTEGRFDILSKLSIYKAFKLLEKNIIVFADEFFETTSVLKLTELSDFEFAEKVQGKDYYIYSEDKEILFTVDWDSFFFLIATDQAKLNRIVHENMFEGFMCDDNTTHNWDYNIGELEKLLEIENKR